MIPKKDHQELLFQEFGQHECEETSFFLLWLLRTFSQNPAEQSKTHIQAEKKKIQAGHMKNHPDMKASDSRVKQPQ